MSQQQLTDAGGIAENRRAQVGNNDANAGGEGCAELLTNIPRIYLLDLGGQRSLTGS
jgi:hypothetical protein